MEEYTRDGLASRLGTRLIGRHLRWHDSLSSTNDLARNLAEIGVPEGTVIVAEEQTAGRGRHGRPWASPRGGIWLSVILHPGLAPADTPLVGLAASTATARAIRQTLGLLARLKWPNDVLIEGRKVAGILVEAGGDGLWVVAGIGINANIDQGALPDRPAYPATSLLAVTGRPVDRCELACALLRELEHRYEEVRSEAGRLGVLRRWREMADTLSRAVRVEASGRVLEGVATDIDDTGALLLRQRNGTVRRVVAGDLTVREV